MEVRIREVHTEFTDPFMHGIAEPCDHKVHRGSHGDLSVISVPCLGDLGENASLSFIARGNP
jgi:hypothetical protein